MRLRRWSRGVGEGCRRAKRRNDRGRRGFAGLSRAFCRFSTATTTDGYYDSWCYLPLLAFLTFDRESEQHLYAALLLPGNPPATKGAIGLLARLLPLLRSAFPRAQFLVRLDGGFATPALFHFLEAERSGSIGPANLPAGNEDT